MTTFIAFLLGLWVGAMIGVFAMCLCIVSKACDDEGIGRMLDGE